jgi:hypothetical protein
MSDIDGRVLAFVEANPGATSRAVATHIFGEAKARSTERTRISAALRMLVAAGRLTKTSRPATLNSLPCNLYWPAPEDSARAGVMLNRQQRHLIRHVLTHGLAAGTLGLASEQLLAHLEAEERRIG